MQVNIYTACKDIKPKQVCLSLKQVDATNVLKYYVILNIK